MSASLVVLLVVLTSVIHEDDACKELKPTTHFKNGMVEGKFYWITHKLAYRSQSNANKCYFSYSFVDGKNWTFIDVSQTKNGTQKFVKEVGIMDHPGHWTVFSTFPDGKSFNYSMTALGGKSNVWSLLYSCNPKTRSYAMWFLYKKRTHVRGIDPKTRMNINTVLRDHNLTFFAAQQVDNTNCSCN